MSPYPWVVKNRPIRCNNPGSLDYHESIQWVGLVGFDGRLCIFKEPRFGIRALTAQAFRYLKPVAEGGRGLITPLNFISVYSPTSDGNDVTGYAKYVAKRLSIGINDSMDINVHLVPLVKSIAAMEMGYNIENVWGTQERDLGLHLGLIHCGLRTEGVTV